MMPQSFTVYDILARNASIRGERTALVTENGRRCDFRAMLERVDRLAAGLAEAGLSRGDRLVVLAQNSSVYFELYFAAARLGIVLYPLNWRWTAEEVAGSLGRAKARGIMIERQYHDVLPADLGEDCRLRWEFDPGAQGPAEGWGSVEDLYRPGAPVPAGRVRASDPFAIISTAAVDVIPRGAVLTHSNVLFSNLQSIEAMGLDENDGNALFLPLFHVAALSGSLAVMHAGGQNVIMTGFDAERAVRLIDEHGLTFMGDFPPILMTVLDKAKELGTALPSLKHVNGLDAPDTIARLHEETGADFWTGFGQTETSGFVTLQRARAKPGAAGKAGAVCQLKLVDDYDNEVPMGTPGEILVRGPVVFDGYFDQPEVNEHTFRNGWHHTGDVGRFDENGTLYYVKRKPEKELIKPGGENVYPAEVERVVMEMDGVRAVCVFGVGDSRWGEAVAAVVEADEGVHVGDEVREFVAGRIARFKRPAHVGFMETLPRDDAGGVDRDAVKSLWAPRFQGKDR